MKLSRRSFMGVCAGTGLAAVSGRARSEEVVSDEASWAERRKAIERGWLELLGPFPASAPPLDAESKRVDATSRFRRNRMNVCRATC